MGLNSLQPSKVYFAADDANICASNLLNKGKTFFNLMQSNYYLNKLRNMWYYYHGQFSNVSHEIGEAGEQGEYMTLNVNHFRNLGEHTINLVTSTKPMMEARAANTDYKSLAQTYLANGILEYYMREKGMERALRKAVDYAVVLGAGYVRMEWNATAGEDYDVDEVTGDVIKEGEIEFTNLSPLDVIFDGTKETWDHNWLMVRTYKNRYDLIAKFPEFEEKIMSVQSKNIINKYTLSVFSNDDTDDIPVFEFYHKKTEALPEGRYMQFLDSDIVLIDTPMPYRRIPVFRLVHSEFLGTCYGYTPLFDVYPIQEALNSMYSSVFTNNSAFAVQSLFIQKGSDISMSQIEGGMNFIEGTIKPEPINFTATAPETYGFIKTLEEVAETISGINSVTRGNPEASLKSGTALALVQSMSLQFASKFQQNYVKLMEETGTALIEMLKDFATAPKVIAVVGKNNKSLLKEFTGDDLHSINRVIVDVGNALSRSIAGRVQMAEQLAQMNLLKSPNEYFQVINTGSIESVYEGEMSENLLIKSENERLLQGEEVMSTFLDEHKQHIIEHRAVIADPELRTNPKLVGLALRHIQEHIDALRDVDADLLQIIGQQPLNPVAMPGQGLAPNTQNPGLNQSQTGNPSQTMQQAPGPQEMMNRASGEVQNPNIPEVNPELLPNPELQQGKL